ncbi:MAG: 30S ribosomal protein S4 [Thermoprotei archaeon]|nr:MAG: 30S ribosomal protein S4 [Thermoprotei archaeon]RLF17657.1 MAG: 30S ribosomal protein S4 [Thermoprotei archaeon]
MGDPKRQRKKWRGPRHPWRREVLQQELELLGKYGLRNKHELWKAKYIIEKIRYQARRLLAMADEERRCQLIEKLVKMNLLPPGATLDDVLSLTVNDLLERRLQTVVYRKGLAKTIHQARQLITHGHIAIGDQVVSCPGYIVGRDEEDKVCYSPRSVYASLPPS